jgi:hypothetical protein
VNSYIYQVVGSALQAAHVHNLSVPCGDKYNTPSGNLTVDLPTSIGPSSATGLTSYTTAAIAGADNFVDGDVTIKDVFDVIVNTTRCVTPTCVFSVICPNPCGLLTPPRTKSEPSGTLGTRGRKDFLKRYSDDSQSSYTSYGWPTRSVERLPPYSPNKLKNPVLLIGNTVREPHTRFRVIP